MTNRRKFLKFGLAAAATPLALPLPARAAKPATRTLGRTKLAVSEVGMGVMITPNPEVVRAAFEAGVTYFDTARVSMGGRNEAILAEWLEPRRKDVVVATKCASFGSTAAIAASCEQSLTALKTDWIDVYQLHGLSGLCLQRTRQLQRARGGPGRRGRLVSPRLTRGRARP